MIVFKIVAENGFINYAPYYLIYHSNTFILIWQNFLKLNIEEICWFVAATKKKDLTYKKKTRIM